MTKRIALPPAAVCTILSRAFSSEALPSARRLNFNPQEVAVTARPHLPEAQLQKRVLHALDPQASPSRVISVP